MLASFEEVSEKLGWSSFRASLLLFGWASNELANISFLIGWEDIWDLTSIKNIVDILKETFLLDLCISEQEGSWVSFSSNESHELFDIFSPLLSSIILFNLYLIDIKVSHLGGKSGK